MLYAQVVLPLAQPMYSFSVDEALSVVEGDAVVVQFGPSRYYTGIVWSLSSERPSYPRIKPILKRLYSAPLLTPEAQRLWEWMAEYYMCSVGEVMRLALPSLAKPSATSLAALDERSIEPPMESFVALTPELRTEEALAAYAEQHSRRAPRRTAVMDRIAALAIERNASDGFVPRRLVDATTEQLADLRKRGLVLSEQRPVERSHSAMEFLLPTLSEAQAHALAAIRKAHSDNKVALLHGVTGSGKTEIYVHLIADALAAGRDVVMLVPEIVITSQLIERLERIFEGRTTTYHSRLTALRRGQTFLRLALARGGELVVGVRSSLFLPVHRGALVIVDEEHDPSFKQSDMQPRYNARDMAVVMSKTHAAKVVLGSATPALESYLNALAGKYAYVELKERWGEGVLPEVIVSDTIRSVKRGERKTHFNFDLLNHISRSLAAGEQAILFQNRRGYAPYLQCRTCGYSPRCPHCNVTLTEHRATRRMECHYCGYTIERPQVCPNCETQDIATMGFGTEKVEEEISRLFPEARVDRLDGDTSTSERAFKQIVHRFESRETDILVGTQILTKGFDFAGVTTVGILNADNLLTTPDFRASERAFQLMMQVAGRAGRRNDRGRVVVQTSQPKHPVIQYVASGDYHAMARTELAEREAFGYPPYAHLIRLTLSNADYELLRHASHALAEAMRRKFGARVMGPVSAAREMLRGEHRSELMLKIESGASMSRARKLLREAIAVVAEAKEYKSVKIYVDVDAS
uniref:replication restart helicase PriA n=1 Tax=Alistipes sp. TaxID=1872444 RepID=UPI004057AB3E